MVGQQPPWPRLTAIPLKADTLAFGVPCFQIHTWHKESFEARGLRFWGGSGYRLRGEDPVKKFTGFLLKTLATDRGPEYLASWQSESPAIARLVEIGPRFFRRKPNRLHWQLCQECFLTLWN